LILDEITLTNFGIYKGEHKVSLTPKSKKPIILFGAYNGSGKTTFLEALQLVLYGKSAKTAGRGRLSYDEYLESLINRDTPKRQGAGLSLKFRTRHEGKEEFLEITRTWFESGNNIKENFQVIRNNTLDSISSERWGEFVEEIMPSQISELFFFDGEKIEGLADPARSSSLLRTGIYSLLGINSIDNLMKSLTQIEKKKTLELAKSSEKADIEKEEAIAKQLTIKYESNNQDIANLNNQIDQAIRSKEFIEGQMKISGADLLKNRHVLENQLADLNEKKRFLNAELINISSGLAPLIVVQDILESLRSEVKKSSGHNLKTLSIVNSEFKLLLSRITNRNLSTESLVSFESAIRNRLDEINKEVNGSPFDVDLSEIPNIEELDDLKKIINDKIKDSEGFDDEIEVISKSLLAVPNEEKVKDIVSELNNVQNTLFKIEVKRDLLLENERAITEELTKVGKSISSKLAAIAEQETESEINSRVISHIKKSKNTLEKFKASLISKHIHTLSDEITDCFRLLHRKQKFDLKFSINSDNFTLSINKPNNLPVSANTLSAGERQLLAVAILWALAKSSGKTLPTVIDTPLGRLDGPHRQKLIKNYFPKASSQVLIFSTDEEVTKEHYESLKPHIAAEYKINYLEETESSSFEEGYF
jgi:DNA sulfur modification protein DndD